MTATMRDEQFDPKRRRRYALPPHSILVVGLLMAVSFGVQAQQLSRDQWGGMPVTVSHRNGNWIIKGKQHTVTVDDRNLALNIETAVAKWSTVASSAHDMLLKAGAEEFAAGLSQAGKIDIVPYDAGFKTGIKISLADWTHNGTALDLKLYLTVCLEGRDEDLVFEVAAREGQTTLRQLDWPGALDARELDYTVLSNGRGTLLPRNWPREYYPIRTITSEGRIAATDHSLLQSHVIESWSMSWWGFQKGQSAMMTIVETPDDAAYQFKHPPGGPTEIGPRWLAQLSRFNYPRSARMIFFDHGTSVEMAKRYG